MRRVAPILIGVAVAACSSDEPVDERPRCGGFPKPPPPSPMLERLATLPGPPTRVVAGGYDSEAFALVGNEVHRIAKDGTVSLALSIAGEALDIATVLSDLWVVRKREGGPGATEPIVEIMRHAQKAGVFPPGEGKVSHSFKATADTRVSLVSVGNMYLYFGVDDADGKAADPTSPLGKIFRAKLRETGFEAPPQLFARGVRRPTIDVDPGTGDLWMIDRGAEIDELNRVDEGHDYGWPTREGQRCVPPATTCPPTNATDARLELVGGDRPRLPAGGSALFGMARAGALSGALLYRGGDGLVAIDPFGPSGPPTVTAYPLAASPDARVVGRTSDFTPVVADGAALFTLVDHSLDGVPATLAKTGCFDATRPDGAIANAIPYTVGVPLWSDGALKDRFAVVGDKKITVTADGDFRFPVGSVLVKTFAFDGKRVETRLLVQHGIEDWAGYAYAWNGDGTEAKLVRGRQAFYRVRQGSSGGYDVWTIPSRADCNACHTPAAGYSLGVEARQLLAPPATIEPFLASIVNDNPAARPPPLAPLDGPGTVEQKARSYLHANCAGCHRDGSSTGLAELDLRVDVPLGKTGLCGDPKTVDLGVAGAKILTAGEPKKSTLALRMRALDDTRMPKLGSRVVDDAAVKVVEEWIGSLPSCN